MIGALLDGKYRITGLIGTGGMSAIYEAQPVGVDQIVAIKVLNPSLADDPEAIARLRHEAQVVNAIGHPNICAVYDMGRTREGVPYLVMERLVGHNMAERIRSGPMTFRELAPLLVQVLAALAAAHAAGVIHRDLKPENVFIENRSGVSMAKLLDFGISKSMSYDFVDHARLTHTGMVMGTPYYMAPEQARGDSTLDQRVDLWAVGVILYEALTGRRPFVATNYNALLVKILTSRPRPIQKIVSTIPDQVSWLVDKALSKLREDRFQTARDFSDAIQRVAYACGSYSPVLTATLVEPETSVTRADRVARRSWIEHEDPETMIDDDALRLREDELGDDAREHDTWRPPAAPPDTEVMRRRDLEALAARDARRTDSDAPDDEGQDTEVIQRRHERHSRPRAGYGDPPDSEPDTLVPLESDPGWSDEATHQASAPKRPKPRQK
jgi:serine/threonine protein kinase